MVENEPITHTGPVNTNLQNNPTSKKIPNMRVRSHKPITSKDHLLKKFQEDLMRVHSKSENTHEKGLGNSGEIGTEQVASKNHPDYKLPDAIICMLKHSHPKMYRTRTHLGYYLQESLNIDSSYAQTLLEMMSKMHVLSKLNEEQGCRILITNFDELPADVRELLFKHGHTEESLRALFEYRKN